MLAPFQLRAACFAIAEQLSEAGGHMLQRHRQAAGGNAAEKPHRHLKPAAEPRNFPAFKVRAKRSTQGALPG